MNEPSRHDPADQSGDSDLDARFAEIVARWDEESAMPTPSYEVPVAKETGEPGGEARAQAGSEAGSIEDGAALQGTDEPAAPALPPGRSPPWTPAEGIELPMIWRAPAAGPGPDGLEEHFVPPEPEPLPAGDLQFWAILVGLVGGPLLMLYLIIFDRSAPGWWMAIAIALAAGGFGLLISRLPARREDDGDDGARV